MESIGAGAVAYYPAMHLGLGSVMSATAMNVVMLVSFGIFSWLSWLDLNVDGEDGELEQKYPPPPFVASSELGRTVNFAVVGRPGAGKSSLINALRGLHPQDEGAAAVGAEGGAREPRPYQMNLSSMWPAISVTSIASGDEGADEASLVAASAASAAMAAPPMSKGGGHGGGGADSSGCGSSGEGDAAATGAASGSRSTSAGSGAALSAAAASSSSSSSSFGPARAPPLDPSCCASASPAGDAGVAGVGHAASVRLWDVPGFDSGAQTPDTYCNELGLAYFDAVVVVYTDRLSQFELGVVRKLDETLRVPTFLVRTTVDEDIENELADHGQSEAATVRTLRDEAVEQGASSVFLVDCTDPSQHDMPNLLVGISKVAKARVRALAETECPICFEDFDASKQDCRLCHWCGNVVCGHCARKLRTNPQGEATCPFCRRCTFLFKQRPSSEGSGFWSWFF